MATASDHLTTVLGIVGVDVRELYFLANLALPGSPADAIVSRVARLSYEPVESWDVLYRVKEWLTGLDRSAGGTLFASAMDGQLHVGRGPAWTAIDTRCPKGLNAVWAASDDQAFAVGQAGVRVRLQGAAVSVDADPAARRLNAVHGTSPGHVITVGDRGTLFRFNGRQWEALESPTNHSLLAVLCRSETEVYVAGVDGSLFRWDGADFTPLVAPVVLDFTGLAWFQGALYVTAGTEGVYRLGPEGLDQVTDLCLYRLRVIDNLLYGVGSQQIARYDGTAWVGGNINM
jgi:photosystem II stability/assembly factor-like uncharacterized protein